MTPRPPAFERTLIVVFANIFWGVFITKIQPASGAAPPATQPSATTKTSPTSSPQADDAITPELKAALERVIPADVRNGQRRPNEREKLASTFILMLSVSDNGLNEESAKKNRHNRIETRKALDEQFKELWDKNEHASPEIRQELAAVERLTRESADLVYYFVDRPTTFPTTRESQLDLAGWIEQIPHLLDRTSELDRDLKYHTKRLDLLEEMDELRAKVGKPDESAKIAEKKLAADVALVAEVDAEYAAQVQADSIKMPTTEP